MHKNRHSRSILDLIAKAPSRASRFWDLVDRLGPSDCWEWRGYTDRDGYGAWKIGIHRRVRANRVAFALASGADPGDKIVCHSCDNPRCCNPNHLWLGTPSQNYDDMVKKGRASAPYGRLDLGR